MRLLRANVRKTSKWWELKLLDFDIMADGESEAAIQRPTMIPTVTIRNRMVLWRERILTIALASSAAIDRG